MNNAQAVLKGAQQFLLHMPDPIYIIDLDDRILWVNRAFEALFGFHAEYLYRNGLEFYPEYTSIEIEEYKNQLQHQETVSVYSSRHCRDGTRLYVNINLMPIRNEENRVIAYTVVLKETVSEESLQKQSDRRYRIIAEHTSDTIVLVDNDAVVRYVSPSVKELTGYSTAEYEGIDAFQLIHPDDRERVRRSHMEAVQTGEPVDLEYRIVHKRGDVGYVEARVMPVPDRNGHMEYVVAVARNITKRKREEQELIQSEETSKFLQQSLNRFSSDLANVMKVSELEKRLIDEVRAVLQASLVAIEEIPREEEHRLPDSQDTWIKISEKKHPVYLRFRTERPLQKMEEEWLETAIHYVTILYDNLHLIQDLMNRLETMVVNNETPKWMLRLLFKLSEKERVSLSGDLHDSVLQDLIIWYRKLESLRSQNHFSSGIQAELERIEEGLLDAIHQIRITCNELRPPFLLKMGLVESLKSLLSYTRMFSNYEIEFSAEHFEAVLGEEQLIGLYRIVQELLNNASKHSAASKVQMALTEQPDSIHFAYSDDGVGMDLSSYEGSFQHMGISGIEKRVLSLDGDMEIRSSLNQGFHVSIKIPKQT